MIPSFLMVWSQKASVRRLPSMSTPTGALNHCLCSSRTVMMAIGTMNIWLVSWVMR